MTLFMPASSNDGLGVKIVTLAQPGGDNGDNNDNGSSEDLTSSVASLSMSADNGSAQATPRGSLTLLDAQGFPRALINAEEITAFRTALASTMLFRKRADVHEITVFGAGRQAYWHIRLALLLRGDAIKYLNIINRSFESGRVLLDRLWGGGGGRGAGEEHDGGGDGGGGVRLHRPDTKLVTPQHTEYHRYLKATVRASAAIFLTTPSLEPLFPAEYLTSVQGRRKGRYIAAIGSFTPQMIELHPDVLRQAVAPHHSHHHHKHARQGGAVVVDSLEACLRDAGEVVQARLDANEVVELGELVMLKRDAEKRRLEQERQRTQHRRQASGASVASAHSHKSGDSGVGVEVNDSAATPKGSEQHDGGLRDWLERGNVIYKSVGLGLMDVVVGGELVGLADRRGYGTQIENF
ncbi:uncharacterized protein K452DRAFT_291903 [Aplosporella prunicola CBS 121167]|uniref:Uncharacterized protein n=1 Tax=Aplosporella prunicola CBS 121167 TaxID=1176127 RepID=A0A6A6B153_9PEZI|nr:uncharacterized protein K452DRAFT_292178 [Aplosporella prunicola CBS 121167]XP_033392702.1 uncharacterized protein K452DRAFT_291903 [Aplosporella prunicola CBS 121167]KAF2136747.1 hypothetical protein K452DRAFT_292178 [Aplosporella prunicola CBS 121167]KAF2136984.1 hypothetical protein K452DRAFT_291903 [Aplosporella prunicola CBS 121167]